MLHYGKYVEPETPITGVFSRNGLEYIHEDIDAGIDPVYDSALEEFLADDSDNTGEDFNDGYEQSEFLIGFVLNEKTGLYEEDLNADYSAVGSMGQFDFFNCVHVTRSKYAVFASLCSSCFPGQADGNSPGEYLAYSIPPDVVGEYGDQELKARIFLLSDYYANPDKIRKEYMK